MKKALIILVVVVMVITGMPLIFGMGGMSSCHDCGPFVLGGTGCAAVLFAAAMFAAMLIALVRRRETELLHALAAGVLYRPPRLT